MRGPEVAKVSLRRRAAKIASRLFSSAQTAARPEAPQTWYGATAWFESGVSAGQVLAPFGGTEPRWAGEPSERPTLEKSWRSSTEPGAALWVSDEPMKPILNGLKPLVSFIRIPFF